MGIRVGEKIGEYVIIEFQGREFFMKEEKY